MQSVSSAVSVQIMAEPSIRESAEQKEEKKAKKEIEEKEEEKQTKEEKKKEILLQNRQRLEKERLEREKILKEERLLARNNKEKKQNNQWKTPKKKISAAAYMSRIANASTPVAVSGVLRSARAAQSEVKRSGASKQEIAKALTILKKVIASGNRKIAGLKKEERMENLKRAMKSSHKYNEEERIRKEIKKQKRARKAREIAEMADPDEVIIHDHNEDFICPNELSGNGLFRDLSNIAGSEFNLEVGADMGVCCADTAGAAAVDVTV